MPPPNLHLAAAQAVLAVVDRGRSLENALRAHATTMPHCQQARFHEICYGACRHYHYFDGMLTQLLRKPIAKPHRVLHFILLNGCYQLEHMRIPHYAVVSQSVAAVKESRFNWADKMINGVLRNFLKRRRQLRQQLAPESARHAFPVWLYREIRAHWPAHYAAVLAASNCKPPLTLRVNQRRISRAAYLNQLAQADIAAQPTEHSEWGVTLLNPRPVERIPGFAEGWISVQDEAAQLAGSAFSEAASGAAFGVGERVLDACAAPGGKTCLLLETQPQLAELVAVDLPTRLATLQQNLTRLGLQTASNADTKADADTDTNTNPGIKTKVAVIAADLSQPTTWWDGRLFDRILLDAPCSGSGVIRRHPDIKHRRAPQDIAHFARQQFTLLANAWSLLANGGTLLYVTCSILPTENDAVIEAFLNQQPDARAQPLHAPAGLATRFGRQRLPGVHPGDGFYYCRLQHAAATIAGHSL